MERPLEPGSDIMVDDEYQYDQEELDRFFLMDIFPKLNKRYYVSHPIAIFFDHYKEEISKQSCLLRQDIRAYDKTLKKINLLILSIFGKVGGEYRVRRISYTKRKRKILTSIRQAKTKLANFKVERSITPALFNRITDVFFQQMMNKILDGYKLKLARGLGSFYIYRKTNNPKRLSDGRYRYRINWGDTMKTKAKLIEEIGDNKIFKRYRYIAIAKEYIRRGYSVRDAKWLALDDARAGKKYFQYWLDEWNFWMKWTGCRAINNSSISNITLYHFKPTVKNCSKVQKVRYVEGCMERFPYVRNKEVI